MDVLFKIKRNVQSHPPSFNWRTTPNLFIPKSAPYYGHERLTKAMQSDTSVFVNFTIYIPFPVISLITCLGTLIRVCVLKLHKTLVYRLALYHVLSAMEYSILWIAEGALALVNEEITGELQENTTSVYIWDSSRENCPSRIYVMREAWICAIPGLSCANPGSMVCTTNHGLTAQSSDCACANHGSGQSWDCSCAKYRYVHVHV